MFPIELGQNKRIRQCMAATYIDNVGNGKAYAKSISHTVLSNEFQVFRPDNNKSGFEKCVKIYINKPKINLLAFILYNTEKK